MDCPSYPRPQSRGDGRGQSKLICSTDAKEAMAPAAGQGDSRSCHDKGSMRILIKIDRRQQ